MSQQKVRRQLPLRRGFLAASVVFLTLVGTGTASALWSSQESLAPFAADAATVGVSHTVGGGLTHTYTASSLSAAQAVAVTNTGNREAAFSVSVSATSASDLRSHVTARIAVVANTAACTPSATLASPITGLLASTVTLSSSPGALAAGATVIVCVQTAISAVTSHGGKSLTGSVASISTASAQAGWSASTTAASFTQTVTSSVSPHAISTNAWYWIRNIQDPNLCAETKWWAGPDVWQANDCGNDGNWSSSKNELWRFEAAGDGVYRIVNMYIEEVTGQARRWTVTNGSDGQNVTMAFANNAQYEWRSIDHGDGTVSFRLPGPNRCVTIDGSLLGNETQLRTRSCDSSNLNQRFVLDMLEIVVPPPVAFTCSGDQWVMYNSWPQLAGYQHLVTYRAFLDGVLLPSSTYTRATGHDTTLQLVWDNTALHSFLDVNGYGAKLLTVEQTVMGGPWTSTGYGNIVLSETEPVLQCGP